MASFARPVRQECRPTEDTEIDAVYGTTIVVGRASVHSKTADARQSPAAPYRLPVGALRQLDAISVNS
jgi:hypothetical protein